MTRVERMRCLRFVDELYLSGSSCSSVFSMSYGLVQKVFLGLRMMHSIGGFCRPWMVGISKMGRYPLEFHHTSHR